MRLKEIKICNFSRQATVDCDLFDFLFRLEIVIFSEGFFYASDRFDWSEICTDFFFFSVISLEPDAVSYSFLFLMVVILCFIIWFFRRLFTRLMFLVSNNISIV